MHQCTVFLVYSFMILTNTYSHVTTTIIEIQNNFTTQKSSFMLLYSQPLLLSQPCKTLTYLFSVPVVFPFPECHMDGIIQYVAF